MNLVTQMDALSQEELFLYLEQVTGADLDGPQLHMDPLTLRGDLCPSYLAAASHRRVPASVNRWTRPGMTWHLRER